GGGAGKGGGWGAAAVGADERLGPAAREGPRLRARRPERLGGEPGRQKRRALGTGHGPVHRTGPRTSRTGHRPRRQLGREAGWNGLRRPGSPVERGHGEGRVDPPRRGYGLWGGLSPRRPDGGDGEGGRGGAGGEDECAGVRSR